MIWHGYPTTCMVGMGSFLNVWCGVGSYIHVWLSIAHHRHGVVWVVNPYMMGI